MLESELFAMLERTADAAFAVHDNGEIQYWNKAAERLLGYSRCHHLNCGSSYPEDALDR